MKIEIELEEVERLRRELRETKDQLRQAEEQLKAISPETMTRKAKSISIRLFEEYMEAAFAKLGFGPWQGQAVHFEYFIEQKLKNDPWWKSDQVKMNISAFVTDEFRDAFLRIGVIPKEKPTEEEQKDEYAVTL